MNRRTILCLTFLAPLVLTIITVLPGFSQASTKTLSPIGVHADGHTLDTADGRPFFWMGDTAWELIHHTTREEASYYLHTRGQQGYTVIQTVVLSEFNGITKPSALGLLPLIDNDPRKPNPAYFDRIVEIVDEAAANGLYVALVPIWGDKLTAPWGSGPRLFRNDNLPDAHSFGQYLADRLKDRSNVVWILGGDRPARLKGMHNDYLQALGKSAGFPIDQDWTPIWREVAAGLEAGLGRKPVIVYHPQGGEESSSVYLNQEPWLSVNGMQSGHGGGHDLPVWKWIARDYAMTPAKPTLDLEPNYEDINYNQWPSWDPATGYFRDLDVRKQVYRSVFAGACGVTYGHNSVWGFANARNTDVGLVDRDWIDGMQRPAGRQMQYLRALVESRPFFSRIPDQSLIMGDAGEGGQHIQAARDRDGSYAFVYFPAIDTYKTIDLGKFKGKRIRAWWFDPRTGIGTLIDTFEGGKQTQFHTPSYGPDWVLVLDDESAHYSAPGLRRWGN